MPIKIYNTLTKSKEEFQPIKEGEVGIYTCGPTVYNYAHIGNLRAYIFADVLRRMFEYNGYKVKQIINVTDVGHLISDADEGEDKMMKALKREGLEPTVASMKFLADKYFEAYKNDLSDLNVLTPTKFTKATEYIEKMIEIIKKLEDAGFTYQTKQAIYFDISKFPKYGSLFLGQNLEEKKQGVREDVGQDPEKKHFADFALWFFLVGDFEKSVQHWPSPWGEGFPGWHIECSAMSTAELGDKIDIHTGGIDHMTKHHPNEVAQNEGAFGHQVINYWMHNEFVVVGGTGRIAKSAGTFIKLSDVKEKGIDPLAYRYYLLNSTYRQKVDFSWESLQSAANALKNLYTLVSKFDSPGDRGCDKYEKEFLESINDDLNTPKALACAWNMLKDNQIPDSEKANSILKFDKVLGLGLGKYLGKKEDIPDEIAKMAEERKQAKLEKKFELSDSLRAKISEAGYIVEDLPGGDYKISKK